MPRNNIPSYEKINYSLRPSKQIERKMLLEAFRRLYHFERVDKYRYIGLGSVYFSDFILMHKALGVEDMLSIEDEDDDGKQERFKFNCPYGCISLEFKKSTAVLAKVPWDKRTILWLDYDQRIQNYMLQDIEFFCANAIPGSMIIITLNANDADMDSRRKPDEIKSALQKELNRIKGRLGHKKIPRGTKWKDLQKWGTAHVLRTIINNHITEVLSSRNGVLSPEDKINYTQLFNFHYADGAKMLTVGGVIHRKSSPNILENVFSDLSFIRTNTQAYHIQEPKLTYRELRYLDRQLPSTSVTSINSTGIPQEHLETYADIYRYFPTFAETEI